MIELAIEWNIPEDISLLYRYSAGVWTRYFYYQTDDGIAIFADNFGVDDAVYFICNGYPSEQGGDKSSHSHKFAGLRIEVAEGVQGDGYSYVWEYYADGYVWKPLPNLEDPSDGLQVEGVHDITWDIPSDWLCASRPCNNDYWSSGYLVRLRVTGVSNPVSGGSFGTSQTIKQFNYAYVISDGGEYTPEDIYQLDQSLGNNLVTKSDDDLFYKVLANVAIRNGKLVVPTYSMFVVGNLDSPYGYNRFSGYEILLNRDGEIELEGSALFWNNSFFQGRYNYWNGTLRMSKGSWFKKAFGGYVALTIAGLVDIEDSQLMTHYVSDTLYFHGRAYGNVRRTNIVVKNFYMYTGKITWEDVVMKTLGNVTTNYQILGGTSQFKIYMEGFDFRNEIKATSTQGAEMWFVNPRNFDESLVSLGNTYGKYSNVIWLGYELDLRVIDEKGNPVEGAKVFIRDKNGHTAVIRDWGKTDGWHCYGLVTDTTTIGYFRKYDQTYTSYVGQQPPFLSVGDIFRVRGEYIKITALYSNGKFICERNQTYEGYTSIGYPSGTTLSPVYTEEEFIETNADGRAVFSGEFGEFLPILVNKIYIEDKNDNRQDREYRPFAIIVAREGYDPVEVPLDPVRKTSLTIKLARSRINPDLEEFI